MARLRDVARRAGVSSTTVSHVLNQSRRVHPETQERVRQAVSALDYRPNILARSLRRARTNTIGLLVSDIELAYFTEIARAVETTAHERGYSVVLCNTDESLEKEILYTEVLLGKQVDGLIIAPAPGDHAYLRRHLDRGARVVFINRQIPGIDVPAVVADDVESTRRLTARLIAEGHRRIGALVGLPHVSTTERRLTGFEQALAEAGLDPGAAWVFPGGARREGGFLAARALADQTEQPTAIVAFNTSMIDGLLLGLLEIAPHLLGQLEVTGYGISSVARICGACRFAIDAPTRAIGRTAATLLLDTLQDDAPWRATTTMLAAELIDLEVKASQNDRALSIAGRK